MLASVQAAVTQKGAKSVSGPAFSDQNKSWLKRKQDTGGDSDDLQDDSKDLQDDFLEGQHMSHIFASSAHGSTNADNRLHVLCPTGMSTSISTSTAQHSTAHSTAQHSTAQHSTAQLSMLLCCNGPQ